MKLVGFDIETRGLVDRKFALQPHRLRTGEAEITSYAAVWDTKTVEATSEATPAKLEDFFHRAIGEDAYVVGWNTPFDCAWMMAVSPAMEDLCFKVKWLDGMLLWKHRQNMPRYLASHIKSYGLKNAVALFIPEHAGYGENIDFQDMSPEMRAKRLRYNILDSAFTRSLSLRFIKEMDPLTLKNALIEAKSIPHVAQAMLHGVKVNVGASTKLNARLSQDEITSFTALRLMDGTITEEVLASPKQLSQMLSQWDLYRKANVHKMTLSGQMSTDKDVLASLSMVDDRAKLIHQNREASYLRQKFAIGPIESAEYNGDGFTRPAPMIFGTYTGRMTYSSKQGRGKEEVPTGVALHQWKRDPEYREGIEAPDGFTLLEFDFAGQEFRWMAVFSGDPVMLELCQPGEDAHGFMGARIGQRDYRDLVRLVGDGDKEAKRFRQLGKVANLSLQYRTSANTLVQVARVQHRINIEPRDALAIHATYQHTYRRVPIYWRKQIMHGRQHGFVSSIGGRVVQVEEGRYWTAEDRWKRESTCINEPIQGSGADQKYLAIACASDVVRGLGGRFYFELHDGMFFIVPNAKAEKAAHVIKHVMSNLPYEKAWGFKSPIPFPVDAKMGKSWGSLKEVH